jgi:hypothetical protein
MSHGLVRCSHFLIFWLLIGLATWCRAQPVQPVSVIKVLVLYTPQASAGAGGANALLKEIDVAMVEANTVFQNSHINGRVHLALAAEINYVESGSVANDLAKLRNPGIGILAQAHRLRDSVGADLVCLITETGSDWWFYGLQGPSAENAFSIIRQPYLTGGYYFPVVLSFNFGCQLERPYADSVGAFPYAYGYSFWAGGTYFSTVEAFSGTRIPYFSNPDILFQGVPTGVPAGSPNAANNALVMNQTAPTVAAFHGPATVTFPPSVSLIAPGAGQIFRAGTNVILNASATDSDGTVVRVDYYEGTNLLASSETPPFKALWSKVPLGEHTLFAVATDNSGASTISDPVPTTVAPANDDFVARSRITGPDAVVNADNTLASAEPGEPDHAGSPAAHSLWWTYTAPADGVVLLDASASSFPASVDVYTGSALNALSEITSTRGTSESAVRFQATSGQAYPIAIDGPNGQTGNIQLHLSSAPLTSNDDFGQRQPLKGSQIGVKANNRGASRESGEPNHSDTPGCASLWWTWTAPANGAFTLSATNISGGNMLVGVYTGDALTNLSPAPVQFQYPSSFFVPVESGMAYQIAVDSPVDPLQPGPFEMNLSFTPEPRNDHFSSRTTIQGTWITLTNPMALATVEPGTPVHNGGWLPSLWWSWTAPLSGYVSITCPTGQFIDVFTGTLLTNLTAVNSGSAVNFEATAGTTYAIAASGLGSMVELNLALSTIQVVAPTNGATFWGGTNVKLTATARANDGILRQLQFFQNGVLIGAVKRAPFQILWTNVPAGDYTLTAVGTDLLGHRRSSPPVNITVQNPSPQYPTPPNDNFARRTPIRGTGITLTNSDLGATREPGEPQIDLTEYDNSIWWSWTAPTSGQVSISTTTPFTTLAVYTGSSLSNLTLVTDGYQGVNFEASAGTTYDLTAVGWPGDVVLQLVLANLRIVNPTNMEWFVTGTNITIQAQPTATEQPVQKIEFFRDGTSLGIASAPPYTIAWTNIPGGDSSLTAVATDSAGYARSSPAVIIHASPPNDDFTNALELTGNYIHAAGSTAGATLETDEPGPQESVQTGRSVWYSWTPPVTGTYSIVAHPDSDWEMTLQVFTGSILTNLALVNAPESRLTTTFTAIAGITYYLQLIDADGIGFTIDIAPVPANDDFGNAVVLVGTKAGTTGNNLMATSEPGEPNHTGNNPGGRSVWYTWTAPSPGFVTVSAAGTNFTPAMDVYTGTTVSALSPVGTNGPAGVSFIATAGTTYKIALDGSGGFFTLNLSMILPPGNDDFESRLLLIGMNPTVLGTTYLATFQSGEPGFFPWVVKSSVWYSWVAPADGTVWVHCPGCPTAVYTGGTVSNLVAVTPPTQSSFADLAFTATAGTEYEIAVAGAGWLPNQFTLSLVMPKAQIASPTNETAFPAPARFAIVTRTIDIDGAVVSVSFFDGTNLLSTVTNAPFQMDYRNVSAGSHGLSVQSTDQNGLTTTSEQVEVRVQPPNDNFAQRIAISGTLTNWVADNSGATTEPGEYLPGGASGRTLWWSWTAPTNGTITIGTAGFSTASAATVTSGNSAAVSNSTLADGVRANDVIIISPGWGPPGPTTGPLVAIYTNLTLEEGGLCASNSGWFSTGSITINPTNGTATYNGEWYVLPSFTFSVSRGQTYEISLDGINGSYGLASVNLSFTPAPLPPANDNFSQRTMLLGAAPSTNGTTVGATREPGEPSDGTGTNARTVWYSWTAPATGVVQANASGASSLAIAFYVGTNISTLIPVTMGMDLTSFYALAGTTYQIAIADPDGLETSFALSLQGPPSPPLLDPTNTFRQSNGAYQVCIIGTAGQSFIVQASSDRQNWVTIRTDTLLGNSLKFVDVTAEKFAKRYYRVLPLDEALNTEPLSILSAGMPAGGSFSLLLSGTPGQPFRLQGSTNLLDWDDVTSGILTNQLIQFNDDATKYEQRFYRGLPQ